MSNLLADKAAVVTGGASGLGRAISTRFAEHGADVVVADIREEPREGGEPTHQRIAKETDVETAYVECDVTDVDALEESVDAAEAFGGIDVMVNNAGIIEVSDFLEVTEAEYDRVLDVNLKGTFFGSQLAGRRMADNGGGSIVNLSSYGGLVGDGDTATYCGSKGGVRLITYSVADALGSEGVRANALHPGVIESAMTDADLGVIGTEIEEAVREEIPSGRIGETGDVADAALYLASDLSAYVNGESLAVDGGLANTN
jgi:NAD(P)-dependent dehydrogenase (short-subunit alcohol dehydrogenase family)